MKTTSITWETDGTDVDLPQIVMIPQGIGQDEVADFLSDKYGWLVSGLTLTKATFCPRCVEDYDNPDDINKRLKGTEEPSDCAECGVCKDCEHLLDCKQLN